jgi:hypothetical protein
VHPDRCEEKRQERRAEEAAERRQNRTVAGECGIAVPTKKATKTG